VSQRDSQGRERNTRLFELTAPPKRSVRARPDPQMDEIREENDGLMSHRS